MAYKYDISGCEALKQGGFDFYISDVLHYIKVGDATVNQLKGAGILPDKSYGSLNVHKPDGLIVNEKNSIQVLVEYKKPGEFSSSKAALDLIYSWYFKLADKLNCNVICITDGDNTYWFHAKSHMQITDEKGNFLHYLLDISRLTDNKMTIEEKRSLASLVNRFAKISNKGQLEAEITLNPQELANNVWQKIWISTGTIGCEICHKKNCNTMRNVVYITLAIVATLFFHGCTKDNSDIDEHVWKLTKIETANGFSSKMPNIERPERDDRYILRFNKDLAIAQMFLIVNRWSAHYQIVQNGSITLSGNTTTEVGYNGNEIWVEDTINAYGSDTFDYAIDGKKLTIQSPNITMTFLCIE